MAASLEVDNRSLKRFLSKIGYKGQPLTIKRFKSISIADAKAHWGDAYDRPITLPRTNARLNTKLSLHTVKYIHQVILESSSLHAASCALAVTEPTLAAHLGNFNVKGNPLDFKTFKNMTVEEVQGIWGDNYTKQMVAEAKKFSDFPFSYIHAQIREAANLERAAGRLGHASDTLSRYLGCILYKEDTLTFDLLHQMTVEEANAYWGPDYYKPMVNSIANLDNFTVEFVHKKIATAINPTRASSALGLSNQSITHQLSNFLINGRPLTYEVFKNLSVDEARSLWGDNYQRPMRAPAIRIEDYNFTYIHEILCKSATLRLAAFRLKVRSASISNYLASITYRGAGLTFHTVKQMPIEQAKALAAQRPQPAESQLQRQPRPQPIPILGKRTTQPEAQVIEAEDDNSLLNPQCDETKIKRMLVVDDDDDEDDFSLTWPNPNLFFAAQAPKPHILSPDPESPDSQFEELSWVG